MKPTLLKITSSVANDRLILSESWITNGHWAIKKDLVQNGKKLTADTISTFFNCCHANDMTDEQIKRVLPCDPDLAVKYEMSPMILINNYWIRVFFTVDGKYAFINEQFRKLMNLETLYRSKTNLHLFFNDDCTKAIMELLSFAIVEDPRYSKIKDILDTLNKGVSA